jgi:hypothetical protein
MKKLFLALSAVVCVVAAVGFCAVEKPLEAFVCVYAIPAALAISFGNPHCLGVKGVVFDVQLTNYAHGIAPDFTSSLAELMAPQCIAPAASGQYIAFDDDEAFRYIETRRALGGDMAMIDFPTGSPRFNCDPHALGIPTDAFELERVGEAGVQMLRESKVRTLVSRNALSREKRVFAAYEAGVSAVSGPGDWTDPTVDPVDELDAMVSDLATETGNASIDLVIGLPALKQFRKHPKVKARFPGVDIMNVNLQALVNLLMIPVRGHVGMLPIVMEKSGKAAVKTNIVGARVYALISQKNPSPFDPSAAKTFTTKLGQVDGVGIVERPPFSEVNFVAWSEDIKITGAKCVKRYDVTIGDIEAEA